MNSQNPKKMRRSARNAEEIPVTLKLVKRGTKKSKPHGPATDAESFSSYLISPPKHPDTRTPEEIRARTFKILGGVAFSLLFLMILDAIVPDPESSKKSEQSAPAEFKPDYGSDSQAWVMSQQFVTERLKAPATASYGWQTSDDTTTHIGNGLYLIVAWVDSENSFGANIRTHFACKVQHTPNGGWKLVELNFR